MTRAVLALSAGVLACAPIQSGAQNGEPPVSRAATTAQMLASADVTAGAGNHRASRKALGTVVEALERIGARPLEGEEDLVAGWRAQAGPATAVYRGRVLGPAYRRGWLEPGGELKLEQLFMGGQQASVAVAATPNQPLRLSVQGADASAQCGAAASDCRWTPIFTERYTIRVKNGGAVKTRYYIVFD